MELIPISEKDFQAIIKGSGIYYYSKQQKTDLKKQYGFCPLIFPRKVEISDDFGFCQEYSSMKSAAKDCKIPNYSTIKYACDHGKSSIKRRSDKKIFYVKEL